MTFSHCSSRLRNNRTHRICGTSTSGMEPEPGPAAGHVRDCLTCHESEAEVQVETCGLDGRRGTPGWFQGAAAHGVPPARWKGFNQAAQHVRNRVIDLVKLRRACCDVCGCTFHVYTGLERQQLLLASCLPVTSEERTAAGCCTAQLCG